MNVRAPIGAVKKKNIVGRGQGTGSGCTAGRGNNGQKSRSGYSQKIGFEGGQMSLVRRIPKRGFINKKYEKAFQVVNIKDLNRFNDGDEIDYAVLLKNRMVNKKTHFVKLLGNGELSKKLRIRVNRVSKKAREAVERSGGTLEILGKIE